MEARLNKQQWQVLLAEQEQSGLTVAAFTLIRTWPYSRKVDID